MEKDVVCGMTVTSADAAGHVEHRGQTYYFCGQSCLERFRVDPDAFLGDKAGPQQAAAPGVTQKRTSETAGRRDDTHTIPLRARFGKPGRLRLE